MLKLHTKKYQSRKTNHVLNNFNTNNEESVVIGMRDRTLEELDEDLELLIFFHSGRTGIKSYKVFFIEIRKEVKSK